MDSVIQVAVFLKNRQTNKQNRAPQISPHFNLSVNIPVGVLSALSSNIYGGRPRVKLQSSCDLMSLDCLQGRREV